MARIIESQNGCRRIIKLSVDDIISIVKDYQNIVPRNSNFEDVRSYLSDRVIFGTGQALKKIVEGEKVKYNTFCQEHYLQIKNFINLFNDLNKKNFPLNLQREAKKTCKELYYFLYEDGFFSDWDSIVANNKKSSKKLTVAFHCKFDGLKIIRALHYLQKTMQ